MPGAVPGGRESRVSNPDKVSDRPKLMSGLFIKSGCLSSLFKEEQGLQECFQG